MITLQVPLSLETLKHLCPNTPFDGAFHRFAPLIAHSNQSGQPVRLIHLSFNEYLVSRAQFDKPFYISTSVHETRLAVLCLTILVERFNADLTSMAYEAHCAANFSSGNSNEDTSALSYSLRFWKDHTLNALKLNLQREEGVFTDLIGLLRTFLRDKLELWLETSYAAGCFVSLDPEIVELLRVCICGLYSSRRSIM